MSSVRLHNNISKPIRAAPPCCALAAPPCCALTPVVSTQNNQMITGRPPLRPVAAIRSATPSRIMTTNGRPNIPPNRPNVQPMQFQKDVKNGTNKLQDNQTAVMGKLINPNTRPRGKFR